MKKYLKGILLACMLICLAGSLTACRKPYDTPEIITIEPSQTAFLVPLEGDTTNQVSMDSIEFLKQSKISTKRVQIPHKWLQTGRRNFTGEWIPTMRLIIVERKPVSREWVNGTDGSSTKNQGIITESKDSIGFVVGVSISAQIDEHNATKFLYRYNNKPLEEILDNEIRTKIESKFNEECGKRELEKVMGDKTDILKAVKEEVLPFFEERGITITALGLKGQFDYVDNDIQRAINEKFKAEKREQAQKATNRMNIEKAEADNKVIELQKTIMKEKIELMNVENQKTWIEKWDGKLPQYMTGDSSIMMLQP